MDPCYAYERHLEDGRIIRVTPQLYNALLTISPPPPTGDAVWDDGWEYPTVAHAVVAAVGWDGEGDPPVGWTRQPTTGRRRPDGDPEREYVRP